MTQKRRQPADEPFILVRSSLADVESGTRIAGHAHPWHQLIYVGSGLINVDTEFGSWIAPPSWAIWVPANGVHAIRFTGRSTLRTLYVRAERKLDLPVNCCSLAVSPLLRALILRVVERGMLDERDASEAAMARLILDELGSAGPPPFTLPQPTSAATIHAAEYLGGGSASLSAVARSAGLGTRTLERRFSSETGLTPGRWRQQKKLMGSLELIASGGTVKAAAAAADFASPSAYVAAFRKLFGVTPGRYFTAR